MTAGRTRTVPVVAGPRADVVTPHDLVAIAERRLAHLARPSGLFCFEADQRDPSPGEPLVGSPLHGESVRYTIIVVLGALRRAAATGDTAVDVERHLATVQRYRPALGVGDLGLLLWAETRCGSAGVAATLEALERRITELDDAVGMEVAWVVLGVVAASVADHRTRRLLDRSIAVFDGRIGPGGSLFLHRSPGPGIGATGIGSSWRARFPNFATEIYSLSALVELARHGVVDGALERARRLADVLISLRMADGGWSWLYDARHERVVEPYEVYSVHQDAMAPMALLPLADLTGDERYRQAAYDGLGWLVGRNPLGVAMVERGMIHRSIRRPAASARSHLAANTAAAALGWSGRLDRGGFDVDRTCRPYHLGWILEAWSPTVGRSSDRDAHGGGS